MERIKEAVEILYTGGVICIPTDTLFALSCDATNSAAVNKLYDIKQRSRDKKLPVLFMNTEHVMQHCVMPKIAKKLAKSFWPGKLTMILKLRKSSNIVSDVFDVNTSFIAVRVPKNDEILQIISTLKNPIIGTSANISNGSNLLSYEEVKKEFDQKDVNIFMTQNLNLCGTQSTIITFTNSTFKISREGAISLKELQSCI